MTTAPLFVPQSTTEAAPLRELIPFPASATTAAAVPIPFRATRRQTRDGSFLAALIDCTDEQSQKERAAEGRVRLTVDERQRNEDEARIRRDAAKERQRQDTEKQQRLASQAQQRRQSEDHARQEAAQLRRRFEEQLQRLAVEQQRQEAEERARREAAEKARCEAEEQARVEAEARSRQEEEKTEREAEERFREAMDRVRRAAEERRLREAEEQELAAAEAEQQRTREIAQAIEAEKDPAAAVALQRPSSPLQGCLKRAWSFINRKYTPAKQLRVAETISLGEKRFVAVVHVEGRKFLIGGGASGVALLTQLGDAAPSAVPVAAHPSGSMG